MGIRVWIGVVLLLCAGWALAAGPGVVRKQIESSMLVTGTIDIEPDGRVGGHALDQAEQLPPAVVAFIGRNVPEWKFAPVVVDGKPVRARVSMGLRIVAKRLDEGHFAIRIRNAGFSEYRPGDYPTSKNMPPPKFPNAALRGNVSGTVYLVVRIGRSGRVEDVAAEQVNLRVVDSEKGMQNWRDLLAKVAEKGARAWEFNPPTSGAELDKPYWLARVPIEFIIGGMEKAPKYGEWQAYVPGPHQRIPWLGNNDASPGPDALLAGGVYPIGLGPQLLTPLDQS
jgi:hypothetical protein